MTPKQAHYMMSVKLFTEIIIDSLTNAITIERKKNLDNFSPAMYSDLGELRQDFANILSDYSHRFEDAAEKEKL